MTTLIINIAQLAGVHENSRLLRGKELAELPMIGPAFLLIEDGFIADFGHMYELELKVPHPPREIVDAGGQWVLPAWCDSTRISYLPGAARMSSSIRSGGMSYAEIAAKGGGILNSARRLQETGKTNYSVSPGERLDECSRMGTGAMEIKSGYGLTVEAELKMLRVIRKLKERSPVSIKATFLGAHALPVEYKENRDGYIDLIIRDMLPVIGREKLADYIDVFCESGFTARRNGPDMPGRDLLWPQT